MTKETEEEQTVFNAPCIGCGNTFSFTKESYVGPECPQCWNKHMEDMANYFLKEEIIREKNA